MVNDIEPIEEPFTTESERILAAVNDSTKESLSAIPRRLSGATIRNHIPLLQRANKQRRQNSKEPRIL